MKDPEKLIEEISNAICLEETIDTQARSVLRIVLQAVQRGEVVDYITYKSSGDFCEVVLKPSYKEWMEKK
jgi:hypothetical protein